MAERPLRILLVGTADVGGGAEKVAWDLCQAYRARGYHAWLAVGRKQTDASHVLAIPAHLPGDGWARFCTGVSDRLSPLSRRVRAVRLARTFLVRYLARPGRLLDLWRGREIFDFPASWKLLDLPPERPDLLQCHNLHGYYFDLRALPWLSQQVPTVLRLPDTWLLSGHCAYSLGCERWKTGCGRCPDLTLYPAIRRDATAENWQRKREIYARSRLFIATPSRWLMRQVEQSLLAPSIVEAKVIPNGVDRSVFQPADQRLARSALGIPRDAKVFLFTANGVRQNRYKDYPAIRSAVLRISEHLPDQRVLFLALGENGRGEQIGRANVRFIPYQRDPRAVACYYQAADVYLHAARADTFPNSVLEALACGTPVVATAVGGIPEQVQDDLSGFCVPAGDKEAMAFRALQLIKDPVLRGRCAAAAVEDAASRFDLQRQVEDYLTWYSRIVERWNEERVALRGASALR